jgi:hypothetical protein
LQARSKFGIVGLKFLFYLNFKMVTFKNKTLQKTSCQCHI